MTSPLDTIKGAILGVPFDPNKKPSRQGTVQAFAEMQVQLEGAQAGALVRDTLANLNALASVSEASVMAWVTNDPTQANNGIYENTGTDVAPVWTRRIDIPQFVISGVNIGAGTADAIQATTDLPVPIQDGRTLIIVNIVADNTAAMTLSLNGGAVLPILSISGNAILSGTVLNGMHVTGFISGGNFYLITDIASAAVVSAAAASAAKSQQWAEEVEDTEVETGKFSALHHAAKAAASAALLPIVYRTVALLLASTEGSRGLASNWEVRGPSGNYNFTEVAATGSLGEATAGGIELDVVATWAGVYEILAWGPAFDGTTDDTVKIQRAIATGGDLLWPTGETLITGTLDGSLKGSWFGQGKGLSAYSSTFAGSGTFIKCSGANAGNPFIKPPRYWEGFHLNGIDKTGVAVHFGQQGSFIGISRNNGIRVRGFELAVEDFNSYLMSHKDWDILNNVKGWKFAPTDGAGDDGYATTKIWENMHIADNDEYGVYAYPPINSRTWTWKQVVIERNGLTGGTYQAYLRNVNISSQAVYLEGSPLIPAVEFNNVRIWGNEWYVNGTGGFDTTNNALDMDLTGLLMISASDVIANLGSLSRMWLRKSTIQTDIRSNAGMASLDGCVVAGTTVSDNYVNEMSIGKSQDATSHPSTIKLVHSGKKNYSGTINANSSTQVLGDTYFPNITADAVGYGMVLAYHPGLIVQVLPATTGSLVYFNVRLINTTAANITLASVDIMWIIMKMTPTVY